VADSDCPNPKDDMELPRYIDVSRTQLPTIARMHSTVFMFCVGLFLAYSMQVYSAIESLEKTIYREAKSIYYIGVRVQGRGPAFFATVYGSEQVPEPNVTSMPSGHASGRPDAVWKDRVTEFMNLATTGSQHGSPESRGQRICDVLIELQNYYPFPEFRGADRINLRFETLDEVDAWAEDMTTLRNVILNVIKDVHFHEVSAVVEAYSSKWMRTELKRLYGEGPATDGYSTKVLAVQSPAAVFAALCDTMMRVDDIVSSVRNHLGELRVLRERYPTRRWFLFIASCCFVFFSLAVMLPVYMCVYGSRVPAWVYRCVSFWVPLAFYGVLFIWLFYRLLC
jgi:hypothetical protein